MLVLLFTKRAELAGGGCTGGGREYETRQRQLTRERSGQPDQKDNFDGNASDVENVSNESNVRSNQCNNSQKKPFRADSRTAARFFDEIEVTKHELRRRDVGHQQRARGQGGE